MAGLGNEQLAGKVLQGTCGWSDPSINAWYPPAYNKSAEHRLPFYCRHFPCVEVDSSCYKIPSADQVSRWVKQVLPGFRFHFKVFGLHCQQSCAFGALPKQVRQKFFPDRRSTSAAHPDHVALSDFPPGAEQACWDAFNAAVEPAVKAGHMGCAVFQFQLGFKPSDENRAYILHCRDKLRGDVPMAIELRNRGWFQAPEAMTDLVAWCTQHNLALIAADELRHETYGNQRERQQVLAPGEAHQILPMSLAVTRPDFLYIRLHRRQGTTQRLLPVEEHQTWAEKLKCIAPSLQGPIYFMWGTDWSDAPVVNASTLSKALPHELFYDYATVSAKLVAARPGSISALFARASTASTARAGGLGNRTEGGEGGAGQAAGRVMQEQPQVAGSKRTPEAAGLQDHDHGPSNTVCMKHACLTDDISSGGTAASEAEHMMRLKPTAGHSPQHQGLPTRGESAPSLAHTGPGVQQGSVQQVQASDESVASDPHDHTSGRNRATTTEVKSSTSRHAGGMEQQKPAVQKHAARTSTQVPIQAYFIKQRP